MQLCLRWSAGVTLALASMIAIAACGKPQPPDKEHPPEPQAGQTQG